MKQTFERYRLEKQLFESKNSIVYRATSAAEDKNVVLKVLNNSYPTPAQIARFRHEYGLMHKLGSPYIPKVDGLIKEENRWAIVMEDIGAVGSLDIVLKDKPDLSLFLNIAIQSAEGLLAINKSGIIHKDIKPDNIIFNPETNRLQIIDFGLATELSFEQQSLTGEEDLEGTLPYISPEQTGRMNCTTDYRTDFYSLGIVLYKLCCWELPFQADDAMGWVHSHIAKKPIPLDIKDPQIPKMIARMVDKLISKNKEARYQSVAALIFDLKECQKKWTQDGRIDEFPIARQDISSNFQVSQKLYGREKEISILLSAFERIAEGHGKVEIALVAGYPGIGKSALVHELHKPLIARRGYFIEGKFEQFKSHIPFAGIAQAFADLMRQLLKEPEKKLEAWKNQILDALDKNAKVITDIIPELELIIGKQPEVAELGGVERLNRLNIMFERFTGVFTKAEHPLVIFLDDLQWVDSASLEFLKTITQGLDTRYFLLIGAYRSNEVDASHPFIKALDDIHRREVTINTLELTPLSTEAVESLVADSLQTTPPDVRNLCGVLMEKTEGNPFFLSQFLKTLRQENLLHFDYENVCWKWDVQQIKSRQITDNVVDLMVGRLQQLPESTQELLQLAACVGNRFDLQTLAAIAKTNPVAVAKNLWPCLEQGLLVEAGEALKLIKNMDEGIGFGQDETKNAFLYFLHDRVQQAAYQLIREENRQKIHLEIGRLLLANLSEEEQVEHCFDLADQLNKGQALIQTKEILYQLIELNLTCGKQAISSTAYASAVDYLTIASKLLPENAWERHTLSFSVYLELAKALYPLGNDESVEKIYPNLLSHARDKEEKLAVYLVQMEHYTLSGDFNKGLDACLQGVELHEIHLSKNEDEMKILLEKELKNIEEQLAGREVESIGNLPIMTSPKYQSLMKCLNALWLISYFLGQKNLCAWTSVTMANISLQHGNIPLSGFGYTAYGFVLTQMENYDKAMQFCQLGMEVLNQFENTGIVPGRLYVIYVANVHYYKEAIRAIFSLCSESYKSSLNAGDLAYAGYGLLFLNSFQILAGVPLDKIHQEIKKNLPFFKRADPTGLQLFYQPNVVRIVSVLTEVPQEEFNLEFSQESFLESFGSIPIAMSWFNAARIKLSYLLSEYQSLTDLKEQIAMIRLGFPTSIFIPESYFYTSLTILATFKETPEEKQNEHKELLEEYQNRMKIWSENCEANFLHKYLLVEAEKIRVFDGPMENAVNLYNQAINSAKEHKFLNQEALANKLYGEFWLEKEQGQFAQIYLRQACYLYDQWGAKLLVKNLEKRYPFLSTQTPRGLAAHSKEQTDGMISIKIHSKTGRLQESKRSKWKSVRSRTSKFSTTETYNLDLDTVIKACQAITREIQLKRLLERLITLAIENAGAQKGYLILKRHKKLFVEAEGGAKGGRITVLQAIPVEKNSNLPEAIIRYVARTKESITLNDATNDATFSDDPYIKTHRPKSVLCSPIIHQKKLTGLLYLENNLTDGAFTADRLEMLQIISSQAAISIENAILYDSLTKEMKKRKKTEDNLRENREFLQKILDNSSAVIYVKDKEGKYLLINRLFENLFDIGREEIKGKTDYDIFPREIAEKFRKNDLEVLEAKKPLELEEVAPHDDGLHTYISLKFPIFDQNGNTTAVCAISTDITERKQAEDKNRSALAEKEVMLKEIHHRVKNNLQIISSLLNLQSRSIKDEATLALFAESRSRVRSMALIHEKLYQTKDFSQVDFADYARELSAQLFRAYNVNPDKVRFKIQVEDVSLGIDVAVPCGLIINELLTNALKHAFPGDRKGTVRLELYSKRPVKKKPEHGSQVVLTVSDDGVGLPDGFDISKSMSLGMQLVKTLSEQIDGELQIRPRQGTRFTIRFEAETGEKVGDLRGRKLSAKSS